MAPFKPAKMRSILSEITSQENEFVCIVNQCILDELTTRGLKSLYFKYSEPMLHNTVTFTFTYVKGVMLIDGKPYAYSDTQPDEPIALTDAYSLEDLYNLYKTVKEEVMW